jgi:sulfate transport system substrate-binding protein
VLVGQQGGQEYEMITPRSSILIENPVAVIDSYADKHGTREAADAFVNFLFTPEAQQIFAEYGLRSVDEGVAAATAEQYPPLEDVFTIEEFGGWAEATPTYFGEEGVFTQAISQIQRLAQ